MANSKRKLRANRANARKSTGPKSPRGKAVASRNATVHGLYATDIVITSPQLKESQAHYDHLVQSLRDQFRPTDPLQHHLVVKIANCIWRYRRVVLAESAMIRDNFDSRRKVTEFLAGLDGRDVADDTSHRDRLRDVSPSDIDRAPAVQATEPKMYELVIPHHKDAQRILYYEMRLDRQLTRAYTMLRNLKLAEKPAKFKDPDDTSFAGRNPSAVLPRPPAVPGQ